MSTIHPARSARNPSKRAPSVSELRQKIAAQCRDLIGFAIASGREETTFTEFEQRLLSMYSRLLVRSRPRTVPKLGPQDPK